MSAKVVVRKYAGSYVGGYALFRKRDVKGIPAKTEIRQGQVTPLMVNCRKSEAVRAAKDVNDGIRRAEAAAKAAKTETH